MTTGVDALTSRLAALQRQRTDVQAEEEHVTEELVRTLRQQLSEQSLELEQTRLALGTAREELQYLAPVEEGLRRLREEQEEGVQRARPAPVPPDRLIEAVITFGRAAAEEVVAAVGNVPAARLAHALMSSVSERLASQRIADDVRDEVALLRPPSPPNRLRGAARGFGSNGAAGGSVAGSAAGGAAGEHVSLIQSPSTDIVGALLEYAGGWRTGCALESLSRGWQLAVVDWRRFERSVNLVSPVGPLQTPAEVESAVLRRVGFGAVAAVSRGFPELSELELLGRRPVAVGDPNEVNDLAIEMLTSGCKRLTHLVLRDCAGISAEALRHVATLPELEHLDVAGCDGVLSARGYDSGGEGGEGADRGADERSALLLRQLPSACPKLRRLVLYGCTYVREDDEQALVEAGVLERASCGCETCVGFASARVRLRLALMTASASMGTHGAGPFEGAPE